MNSFYDVKGLEELGVEIGVNLQDNFKYLVNCILMDVNPEDAAKLTPELLEAFKGVRDDCDEFVKTFDFYIKRL